MNLMAMTLRLTDEETEALRAQAEREGRSMQVVARAAIRQYIEQDGHRGRVAAAASAGASRYAEALRRLGEV
jgi:predicted transcriptional regulator